MDKIRLSVNSLENRIPLNIPKDEESMVAMDVNSIVTMGFSNLERNPSFYNGVRVYGERQSLITKVCQIFLL